MENFKNIEQFLSTPILEWCRVTSHFKYKYAQNDRLSIPASNAFYGDSSQWLQGKCLYLFVVPFYGIYCHP